MKKKMVAYTLARLPIGFSFLGHGFIRIPKLNDFANGMTLGFSETLLPLEIVKPFAYALPFLELFLGAFILLGVHMKIISKVGLSLMCILIVGSSFQENWSAIAIQMFYGLYLTLLFLFSAFNTPVYTNKKN